MSNERNKTNRTQLEAQSRNELIVLAQQLGINRISKVSKQALIEAIIQAYEAQSSGADEASWWMRYRSEVFGYASIIGALLSAIGVVLTIIFFVSQRAAPITSNEVDTTIIKKAVPANTDIVGKDEARIAAQADAFSPLTISQFYSSLYDESLTDLQRD